MPDQPRRMMKFLLVALTMGALAMACSSDSTSPIDNNNPDPPDPPEEPEENVIELRSSSFSPALDTVAVNTEIEWRNTLAVEHTVTSDTDEWPHQVVPADNTWTYTHTFDEVGVYDYECQRHSGMTGRIVVE